MTSPKTRGVQPTRKPTPKTHTEYITEHLVSNTDRLAELRARRTECLEQIRALSLNVVALDREVLGIENGLNWTPPAPVVPAPPLEATTGGRPIRGVISSSNWSALLDARRQEDYETLGHFYGRSASGLARLKVRAQNGVLPQSKVHDQLYRMILDGEDAAAICERLKKPMSWVLTYANLLSAYAKRRKAGLAIPPRFEALLA